MAKHQRQLLAKKSEIKKFDERRNAKILNSKAKHNTFGCKKNEIMQLN